MKPRFFQPLQNLETFRNRRTHPRRRGAAMVEFALFFLIFLFLVVGLMEGAMLMWAYSSLTHAARQGARYAMVHGSANPVTDEEIADIVKTHAPGLFTDQMDVATTYDPSNEMGNIVQVRVSYPWQGITRLLGSGDITLAAQSRMVISN